MIMEESTARNRNNDDADVSSIKENTCRRSSPETSLRRRRSLSDQNRDLPGFIKEKENVSNSSENEDSNLNILLLLAGLLIKPIRFLKSLIDVITYPIWFIYTSYMFITDPFGVKRRVKKYAVRISMKIGKFVFGRVSSSISEWLKENKSIWRWGSKGFVWLLYVCVVLIGLLVVAFVIGGLVIKGVAEEPMRVNEPLSFDYAEKSPVAYAPLLEILELGKISGARVIPVNHKMQVTVSLKLPESDYNRNLGIFQVRVDFLAADGKTLASARRPCILQFKSGTLRLLSTFLNVAPLITGYASESQNVNVKLRGFTEGKTPTACLRVIMEPRAEVQRGAGIPEIYTASLTLESELSLLKRSIWYWRKLLFLLISMTMFIMELVFVLLCCTRLVIPRVKPREISPQI